MNEAVPDAPLSTAFVWLEINRRLDSMAHRVDRLDEAGPRGLEALRGQVAQLRADLVEHEAAHQAAAQEQRTARRWQVGLVVSLIVPLYPLILARL